MTDEDLRRELEFHVAQQTDALVAQGLTRDEARRRARLQFGGLSQVREDLRSVHGRWRLIDEIRDDVRFAWRLARRTPFVTAITVTALAIGIGTSSAVFALVDAVLLKPLPYAEPDRLVNIWNRSPRQPDRDNTISPADFRDVAAATRTLERVEGYFGFITNPEIVIADRTEVAFSQVVTPGLFPLLGRSAARGRTLSADAPGPEIVLSDGYWRRRFGADPSVVGRSVNLGPRPATIVGVMPRDFVFPYPDMLGPSGFTRVTAVDMWVSMMFDGPAAVEQRIVGADGQVTRGVRWLGAIARRRADASVEQVRAELSSIGRNLESQFPATNAGWGFNVIPVREQALGAIRPAMLLLFGGVALVLLMATVNVANLMLSRSLERRGEYATRAALGAGRARIVRQSIVESLLLSVVGGLVGLAAAWAGIGQITRLAPPELPRLSEVSADWRVAGVAMSAAVIVGVLIGLLPALGAARTHPHDVLREHGRGATGSRSQRRYRTALLVGQVALACVLTIGAALLLRSFSAVMRIDPGFEPNRLLTWQMNLPDRLTTPDERRAFYREFFERIEGLPGVLSVGGTTRLPLGSTGVTTTLEIQNRPIPPAGRPEVQFRRALHRYFDAMRIPILRGRDFGDEDGPDAPPVAVVNQTMARQLFANEDPIGQRLRTSPTAAWLEIVGVVGDVRHAGLETAPEAELYIPYLQNPPVSPFIVIRTSGDPARLADTVRAEARRIDKDLPLYDLRSMTDVRSAAVAQRRFVMWLVTLFGGVAFVLAAVGIDGVVAVAVSERMPEMSVRLALGADPRQLWRMIVGQTARTTICGLAVGLGLAALLMPAIRAQLFGVQASDPLAWAGTCALFLIVSVVAAIVPARRAAHADPADALRGA